MNYIGDFNAGATVYLFFTTHAATGAAVAPSSAFEAADVVLYKNGGATQRTSQSGWTMTSPFDSVTGLHLLAIDLSDNTDPGFYAAGNEYTAVLSPDESIDARAVVAVLAQFSIQRASALKTAVDALFTTALTESYNVDGAAPTVAQALLGILQVLTESSISATTMTVKKLDGSTTAFTLTLNDPTNPSGITRAS